MRFLLWLEPGDRSSLMGPPSLHILLVGHERARASLQVSAWTKGIHGLTGKPCVMHRARLLVLEMPRGWCLEIQLQN